MTTKCHSILTQRRVDEYLKSILNCVRRCVPISERITTDEIKEVCLLTIN